jgi:hypothetical protein
MFHDLRKIFLFVLVIHFGVQFTLRTGLLLIVACVRVHSPANNRQIIAHAV